MLLVVTWIETVSRFDNFRKLSIYTRSSSMRVCYQETSVFVDSSKPDIPIIRYKLNSQSWGFYSYAVILHTKFSCYRTAVLKSNPTSILQSVRFI
jgi:hypothetical protein